MSSALSLSPDDKEDIDSLMLKVARDLAQDIYPIEDILKARNVSGNQFEAFKQHPRFQQYILSETEAWLSAGNVEQRTKLKAGVVLETFMAEAYTELTDKKTALNQRVELGKMLAKIAGFGEPKSFVGATGAGGTGSAFVLQINIAAGADGGARTITIEPEVSMPPNPADDADIFEEEGFGPRETIDFSMFKEFA